MPDSISAGSMCLAALDLSQGSKIVGLANQGWLLCDGSLYNVSDYPDLFAAIGITSGGVLDNNGNPVQFNVPDSRSRLLRGVNDNAFQPNGLPVDPNTGQRLPQNPLGNRGNAVGSFQLDATALPTNPFTTSSSAGHTHTYVNATSDTHNQWTEAGPQFSNPGSQVNTVQAGLHNHQIVRGAGGGDPVTRPLSTALFWIIKFRNDS